jgi:hypothetical protein
MQKLMYPALVLAVAVFVMAAQAISAGMSIDDMHRMIEATSAGMSIDDMHRMIDMQSLPIQVPDPI